MMLGPFKMLGPFAKLTNEADPKFVRKIAFRAILYSLVTVALAAFLGAGILERVGVPIPILTLSGGIILFLVALLDIIKQFDSTKSQEEKVGQLSLQSAIYPIAFPIIVTPYGIAAVIVFNVISPDLSAKLTVGAMVIGIMLLNLFVMLYCKVLFKYLSIILPILGAILGMLTVALGANIIYNSLLELMVK